MERTITTAAVFKINFLAGTTVVRHNCFQKKATAITVAMPDICTTHNPRQNILRVRKSNMTQNKW
jgi:hypothetical protein